MYLSGYFAIGLATKFTHAAVPESNKALLSDWTKAKFVSFSLTKTDKIEVVFLSLIVCSGLWLFSVMLGDSESIAALSFVGLGGCFACLGIFTLEAYRSHSARKSTVLLSSRPSITAAARTKGSLSFVADTSSAAHACSRGCSLDAGERSEGTERTWRLEKSARNELQETTVTPGVKASVVRRKVARERGSHPRSVNKGGAQIDLHGTRCLLSRCAKWPVLRGLSRSYNS